MKAAVGYGVAMALVVQLVLFGCASTGSNGGGREIQVGDEKSFDGLVEVTNTVPLDQVRLFTLGPAN